MGRARCWRSDPSPPPTSTWSRPWPVSRISLQESATSRSTPTPDRQGIWLAWQDNAPVGCIAAVTYNPDYAFIGLFVVKPEHRGQGIGRRLWHHALKTLSGVQCIGLEAAVQMVGFYERAGFRRTASPPASRCCSQRSITGRKPQPAQRRCHRALARAAAGGNSALRRTP